LSQPNISEIYFMNNNVHLLTYLFTYVLTYVLTYLLTPWSRVLQWRTEGGGRVGVSIPPEIPKALQNRAKFNPTVKNVKSC